MSYDFAPAMKVLHVLLAATWLGYGVAMNFVIVPQLRKLGPAIFGPAASRLGPVGVRVGNIVGGFTLLTGLALAYLQEGDLRFAGARGRMLIVVLAFNVAALWLLNFAMRPSLKRLAELVKESKPGEPPSLMMTILQKRVALNGVLMMALVVLAAVVMVLVDQGVYL